MRHWLFQIDVFACCKRSYGDANVPGIRRCDKDGIESLVVEDFAIVHVRRGRGGIRASLHLVTPRRVHVADGCDLEGNTRTVCRAKQLPHASAGAYDTNTKSVVCSKGSRGAQRGKSTGDEETAA